MAKALAAGAEAVQFFSDIGELLRVSDQWPANKRIRAGERGGSKLDGCDMGNSPLKCTPERVGGDGSLSALLMGPVPCNGFRLLPW